MTPEKKQQLMEMLAKNAFTKYFRIVYTDGSIRKARIFLSSQKNICEKLKGSRRFGRPIPLDNVLDIIPLVKTEKDEEMAWRHRMRKLIAILDESGLWPNIRQDAVNALELGYDKVQNYFKLSWKEREASGIVNMEDWICRCRLEKMYFGKCLNEVYLRRICKAIADGEELQFRLGADKSDCLSYDTSFEYSPEKKSAWYSKEYKGCGNGHYYLALDENYALFYEDD